MLDLFIILCLLDQVVHLELTVEWESNVVDLVILEAPFLTSNKLADELAINVGVLI